MRYVFEPVSIDTDAFTINVSGNPIHLEPRAFKLLVFLIENRERCISRQELIDTLWADRVVTEGSLSNEIKTIRRALGESGKQNRYIRTVHGIGYQFVGLLVRESKVPDFFSEAQLDALDPALQKNNYIPVVDDSYVGRSSEMAQFKNWLVTERLRLVTIAGPGGIGKTRLAIELGHQLDVYFPDGIYFIDLLPVKKTESLIKVIAKHLNAPRSIWSAIENSDECIVELSKFIGKRRLLLILDNFEHLLDNAQSLLELLSPETKLQILVTSRETLRVSKEHCFYLHGLEFQTSSPFQEENLSSLPAIELFFDQAHHNLSLDLRKNNIRIDVQKICKALDGSPLGIKLAASWLRYLPLNDVLREVVNSLKWLETDYRDVPQRHRSVKAIFESTMIRLSKKEQSAFECLTIFRSDFSHEAAQRIANLNLKEISNLEHHSLILLKDRNRYYIHELLRQFGHRRLVTDNTYGATVDAYCDYYMSFCQVSLTKLAGLNLQKHLPMIQKERANLELAIELMCELNRFNQMETCLLVCVDTEGDNIRLMTDYLPILQKKLETESYLKLQSMFMNSLFNGSGPIRNEGFINDQLNIMLTLAKQIQHRGYIGVALQSLSMFEELINGDLDHTINLESYDNLKLFVDRYDGARDNEYLLFTKFLIKSAMMLKDAEAIRYYSNKLLTEATKIGHQKFILSGYWGLAMSGIFSEDKEFALSNFRLILAAVFNMGDFRKYGGLVAGLSEIAILQNDCEEAVRMCGRGQRIKESATKVESPPSRFMDMVRYRFLRNKLGKIRFDEVWQQGKHESFSHIIRNVEAFTAL